MSSTRTVKVGIYGAGNHARNNHLLNLTRLEDVEVVAVCDIVVENPRQAAADFGISSIYTDGHEMIKNESLDTLWSTVVAAAREAGVEVAAAEKGIHIFIEKPQAMDMGIAYRIDDAIRRSGVFSTVCFRERYRPIFQEAKRLLQDKKIVHIRFQMNIGSTRTLAERGGTTLGWRIGTSRSLLRLGTSRSGLLSLHKWTRYNPCPSLFPSSRTVRGTSVLFWQLHYV